MGRRQIAITYSDPEAQPPVFVAGTFSEPQWEPQAMNVVTDSLGGHRFEKVVSVNEGTEIQYKFRIGEGDRWVLDENADKVLDGRGNVNNRLKIGTTPLDDGEFEDDGEPQAEACPMFSHECFGSHNVPASVNSNEASVDPLTPMTNASSRSMDIQDPRVEQFPHDGRRSILAELQKIMTSTEEDRSVPGGVPPSPVVFPTTQPSPSEAEPPAGRLSAPRELLGSVNSVHSQMSLESIEESPEDENYEIQADQPQPSGNRSPRYHASSEWMGKVLEPRAPVMEQSGPANQPTVRLEAPSDDDEDEERVSLSKFSNSKDNALLRERDLIKACDRPNSPASIYTIQSMHSVRSIRQTFKGAG